MPRIITLTPERARVYKELIQDAYIKHHGKPFVPVTYLGAYDAVQESIIKELNPDEHFQISSVSPHRLRKLLYYSDPLICLADKLESTSFGSDFIDILDLIAAHAIQINEQYSHEKISNKSKYIFYLIIPVVVVFISILGFYFFKTKPYYFRDDFNKNSLEDLKKRGWEVMDFDSSLFYPQVDSVLTLRSSRGDYWVRPVDTPYIHNVVFREIKSMKCFEVTTKFSFNGNMEPWQQCGIILLNKDKNKIHNIRMTFTYMGETDPDEHGQIYNRGFQAVKRNMGEAQILMNPIFLKTDSSNQEFYYKIKKVENKYFFLLHRLEESDAFMLFGEMDFNFDPKYIAIASFNGLRINTNGPLNNASSIPAKFDWIRIEECK